VIEAEQRLAAGVGFISENALMQTGATSFLSDVNFWYVTACLCVRPA